MNRAQLEDDLPGLYGTGGKGDNEDPLLCFLCYLLFNSGGAKCGALLPNSVAIDPDLPAVIDAWPDLPEAIKAGIVATVRAAE